MSEERTFGLFLNGEKASLQSGDLLIFDLELSTLSVTRGSAPFHLRDLTGLSGCDKVDIDPAVTTRFETFALVKLFSALTGFGFVLETIEEKHRYMADPKRYIFWKAL